MRSLLFATALFICFAFSIAHADQINTFKPPQSFEDSSDFFIIEGAGLYQGSDKRALDKGLWEHSSRKDITDLVINLPVNTKSPALQKLTKGILLSESSISKLDDYDEITPGRDFLTLRLMKLMQGGYFRDAMQLYSVAIETPHHDDVAKAGIYAMLGTGEKSIACLEMKTLGNMNMSDPFWPALLSYCNATLSNKPTPEAQILLEDSQFTLLKDLAYNPSFIFPYTPETFKQLSLLEKTILIAEGKLEPSQITDDNVTSIPPQDLHALLSMEAIEGKARSLLMIEAVRWGIRSVDDLVNFYKGNSQNVTLLSGMPALYSKLIKLEEKDERLPLLKSVLAKNENFDPIALTPMTKFFKDLSDEDLDYALFKNILPLYYLTNMRVPEELIESYLVAREENLNNPGYTAILLALQNYQKSHGFNNLDNIIHKNGTSDGATQNYEKNFIENLDKEVEHDDNAAKAYEKDKSVVMSDEDFSSFIAPLQKASVSQALGETALLSITVMHDKDVLSFDDIQFQVFTDALRDAKLNKFSQRLAFERLIGDEEE